MSPLPEHLLHAASSLSPEPGEMNQSGNPVLLLFGMRSIAGTMTGSSIHAEDTLSFSLPRGASDDRNRPLANAAEAYGRMMRNEARFRIVLVPEAGNSAMRPHRSSARN